MSYAGSDGVLEQQTQEYGELEFLTRLMPMPTTPPSITSSFCSILRASDLHSRHSSALFTDTQRQGDRERGRHIDRQTDRQTDGQAGDRQRETDN